MDPDVMVMWTIRCCFIKTYKYITEYLVNGNGSKVDATKVAVTKNCGGKEVGVIGCGYVVMVQKYQVGIKLNWDKKYYMELV